MFTIFGVTGNTGAVAARTLLAAGHKVRAVVRDRAKGATLEAAGAEIVVADLETGAGLDAALAGAAGAYTLSPPAPQATEFVARGRRIADHLATAIARAKVPHVVHLSSVAAHEPSGTGPIVTAYNAEQRFRAVEGTRFTFLRAAYFMDNLGGFAHPMKQDGVLPVFGGGESYPFAMVSTLDIGRVAAEALLAPPSGPAPEIIELSGPREYSMADGAAAASELLRRPVTATALPLEAMPGALAAVGMSTDMARLYTEMTAALGTGKIRFDGAGRSVRGTVTLIDALRPLLTA